jgi:glycosyltransferase involved in cell wall biosynthesis
MHDIPVSVVMPVYNCEASVRAAVESIVRQTFTNFECIIIDDGSTDRTAEIVKGLDDRRVRIIENGRHTGPAKTLNRGFDEARGRYIAYMGGNDTAVPERLEAQVFFLDANRDIGIVSSMCSRVDTAGSPRGICEMPENDVEIRWALLLSSPFAHPAVMLRKSVLTEHNLRYSESGEYEAAEDYELWTRLLRHTRGTNIPRALVRITVHEETQAHHHRQMQSARHDSIAFRAIRAYVPGYVVSPEEVCLMRKVFVSGEHDAPGDAGRRTAVLIRYLGLLRAFIKTYRHERLIKAFKEGQTRALLPHLFRLPAMPYGIIAVSRFLFLFPSSFYSSLMYMVKRAGRR